MYWVQPEILDVLDKRCLQVNRRTAEAFQFQLTLTEKDVIPHHLKYGIVNPMLAETPICDMNEPNKYC